MRQVLEQELHKALAQRDTAARQARLRSGRPRDDRDDRDDNDKENNAACKPPVAAAVRRDFFGRVIAPSDGKTPLGEADGNAGAGVATGGREAGWRGRGRGGVGEEEEDPARAAAGGRVWVTYHEGQNNAVRRPISLEDFLRGL